MSARSITPAVLIVYASALRADECVQGRDVRSPSDRDRCRLRVAMADPQRVAGVAEDLRDVGRRVREEVSRIGILPSLHAIGHATAIGVDQATQQLPWVSGDDLLLPRLKPDRSPVLHTGPVLRKDARPVHPAAAHLHAAVSCDVEGPSAWWQNAIDSGSGQTYEMPVARILVDAQAAGAGTHNDVSITEIQAEQI